MLHLDLQCLPRYEDQFAATAGKPKSRSRRSVCNVVRLERKAASSISLLVAVGCVRTKCSSWPRYARQEQRRLACRAGTSSSGLIVEHGPAGQSSKKRARAFQARQPLPSTSGS